MNGLSTARKFETVQPANKYKCKNAPPSEKRKNVNTIHRAEKVKQVKVLEPSTEDKKRFP